MNRIGSLINGVALAALLGAGVAGMVSGGGVRIASAQSHDDQVLQENLASQFFRVEWSAKPDGNSGERISGYVYNEYGEAANQVQIRILAFDASG